MKTKYKSYEIRDVSGPYVIDTYPTLTELKNALGSSVLEKDDRIILVEVTETDITSKFRRKKK